MTVAEIFSVIDWDIFKCEQVEQVEREREQLKAQVDRIKTEINAIINDSQGVAGYYLHGDVALWDEFGLLDILQETPAQCLAEHDAEVAAKAYHDGGSAQKAFWNGFERGVINGPDNIRQHWNEYKKLRQQAKAGK